MKHARALALSLRSDAVPPVPVANASGRRTYAETGFGIEAWFFSWLARLSLREWSSLVGTRVLARLVGWRVANNSSLSTSNPSQSPTQTWPATSPATLTPTHARSCKQQTTISLAHRQTSTRQRDRGIVRSLYQQSWGKTTRENPTTIASMTLCAHSSHRAPGPRRPSPGRSTWMTPSPTSRAS